jgi:hypothetical protein
MLKKRMPVAERQQENRGVMAGPPLAAGDNWPDTSPGGWACKGADVGR